MSDVFVPGQTDYLAYLNTLYNAVILTPTTEFTLAADGSAIGNTIDDFFGALSTPTLVAGARYEFIADLYFLKTTAGTLTFTLTCGNAPVNLVAHYTGGPVAGVGTAGAPITAAVDTSTSAATALPATSSLTTAVEHHFRVLARIDVHATLDSTFKLRCTESAGTITPRRGSSYSLRRMNTSNVGSFV